MLKWAQGTLSAVTGMAEPEYGPDAIHPITDSVKNKNPMRLTTNDDFKWIAPLTTNVETQTFYFTDLKSGNLGFAQIIHSVVSSVYTTAQFTFRLYNKENDELNTWTSTNLEDFVIKGTNFYAKNLSIELVDDGNTYVLKSAVTEESIVNLTVKKIAPGVLVGKDGTTLYGTDVTNPWGSMRHAFWPRNSVTGTIELKSKEKKIEINGYSMFVAAMQGMKPHHAAAAWNFLNFQSETYSAVQMEFTTPNSYAKTKVNVGILVKNDKILSVSVNNKISHLDNDVDEVGWPVPKRVEIDFKGIESTATDDDVEKGTAKVVVAKCVGDLSTLVERVDVMGEIPGFVKTIAGAVSGTKPYIYQFANELTLEVEDDGKSETAKGLAWTEVTFISDISD
ncbi:Svf1 protein [Saccharomycopsis crataegensis]|uniref:Svf1 protein n=1 Tax=Saccharomycopsis crataegensis TaxID=43959 RepID=A0AAV5QG00_9ASCO|nr:Svf1 protein [Saccharomycopsis crataegensis]